MGHPVILFTNWILIIDLYFSGICGSKFRPFCGFRRNRQVAYLLTQFFVNFYFGLRILCFALKAKLTLK